MKFKKNLYLLLCVILVSFCSCLGIGMDITLNQNGTGTIDLEYQISKSLDSLGRLDGNERWNTIPVGRADFERTLDRLKDIKLISFSTKEDSKNLTFTVKMEFSSIQGLMAFLDASGRNSSFGGNPQSGHIKLTLSEGTENKNANLDNLLARVFESYSVRMSMTFPNTGNLALTDKQGRNLGTIPGSVIVHSGKKVSCSFSLYEVLSSADGMNVEFRW